MNETGRSLPLDGVRVLDLSRARSGPTAVRQLADWGADALMIEPPYSVSPDANMSGPRTGPDFQNLNRNKRSMTLNLKDPQGLAIFKRLAVKLRRRARELSPRREASAGHRLRNPGEIQSASDLRQHLWLRPVGPLSRPARLRSDCPGHGRAHVHYWAYRARAPSGQGSPSTI